MQVYKAFFKIILKNLNQIMIYIVVFLSLTIALANTNSNPAKTDFSNTKINIAIINNDGDSKLSKGLENYLGQNANIIDLPNDAQKLQDALFFRKVEYIVKVPAGFSEGFMSGKAVELEKSTVPNSTSAIYLDSIINKYLNTAKVYISNMNNLSEDQLLTYINKDLAQKTEVKMTSSSNEASINQKRATYFNYMAYSLFAVLILGVTAVMMVFNSTDLKRRNMCSPMKLRTMNLQLILGNFSFAILVWFILILMSFLLYKNYMFTASGLLFILNSFVFTFAVLSISYLIGNVIKSRNAMSAAANVVALGGSFISGVFVPQAFLGKTVLQIASFTPSYWFVKANNSIASLVNFNIENLAPIFVNMLIVMGFAVAILSITLVVIKQKTLSN